MSQIKNIAVIGTGVIGAGWIIRCLAHNKIVHAYDKDIKLKKNLITEIKRTWPYVKKLFNKKTINLKNFKYFTSIEEALRDADFIQECASENYALKTKLMSTIGKYSKPNAIISSSSSGLLPTRIYSKCKNPERTIIGHPFNPVYLLPAVEIVPGKKTSKQFLDKAKNVGLDSLAKGSELLNSFALLLRIGADDVTLVALLFNTPPTSLFISLSAILAIRLFMCYSGGIVDQCLSISSVII